MQMVLIQVLCYFFQVERNDEQMKSNWHRSNIQRCTAFYTVEPCDWYYFSDFPWINLCCFWSRWLL